jgi:DDE_Tnp_1-associated
MNYSMLDEAMEQVKLPVEIDALSVYRAMEHIQDGRHKRGVRYSVALIFTLILLAKGAGMTTPLAIAQWVRLRAGWLREVLPITCTSFPCAATVSQCAASRGCRAGQRGADAGIDACDGNPLLWRRTQPPGRTNRAGETCACGPGWQDEASHSRP